MIVAACTGDRRCLKRFRQRVDLVVDDVEADLTQPDTVVVIDLAETIKRRANDRFVDLLLIVPPRLLEQIAGDVLTNKLVVGNVLIQRAD